MARIEKTIEVAVPISVAYDQWTQFEDFPKFMDGVQRVQQLDDRRLAWTAEVGGSTRHWTADIIDQIPDTRIAWRSTSGAQNDGAVDFRAISVDKTRLDLVIEADPDGPLETVGSALGFLDRRVEGDLVRFKEFIEARQAPTGAWTGEIHGGPVGADRGQRDGDRR